MTEIIIFSMALGGLAGFLAGLFGIGGGLVIVPALLALFTYAGFTTKLVMLMALATSLASIIFTSFSSMYAHHRLGAIRWSRVYRLAPGLLLGTALASILAEHLPTHILRWFCAIFMISIALQMMLNYQIVFSGIKQTTVTEMLAGLFIGAVSALVGIGGGTLSVPYLVSCQHPIKNAVAISSACGLPIALAGSVTYVYLGWHAPALPPWSLGYVYLPALVGIVLVSILTAPLGARLAHKLPAQQLKRYFAVLLFGVGLKLFWS